ncbi:MAG: FAD-dependent oxidoreductase [Tannerellaceae bacterium]|nr:FAD-dependent oxidoreductase [Tannerellaceae bacterium]
MKVAVIGAGIGGLAIAVRMAVKGYRVTLIEQAAYPGGKVAELKTAGFRFDTGPSLFTLPELAEELFTLAGEKMEEHLPVIKLENNCRYFFPDGTVFTFYQEKATWNRSCVPGGSKRRKQSSAGCNKPGRCTS